MILILIVMPLNFCFKCVHNTSAVSPEAEVRIVVQVLRLNTLSKLTFADRQRFDALVHDVFTGVEFRDVEYGSLEAALREASRERNLVVSDRQVRAAVLVCLSRYIVHVCARLL